MRVIMPNSKPPCMSCQDRYVAEDGRTCHSTCEKYNKFRDDRYELWKKQSKEAASDRALASFAVKRALRATRQKPREV